MEFIKKWHFQSSILDGDGRSAINAFYKSIDAMPNMNVARTKTSIPLVSELVRFPVATFTKRRNTPHHTSFIIVKGPQGVVVPCPSLIHCPDYISLESQKRLPYTHTTTRNYRKPDFQVLKVNLCTTVSIFPRYRTPCSLLLFIIFGLSMLGF